MGKVKISVIVPIYNVEKYLDECLDSIRKQTFTDFEVLLIDDGTPDNSVDIAKKYTELDSRFTLYHKKNGGLSDARNYGLERANGEYVAFIDSDDRIREKYLESLYNIITEYDADIAVCAFSFYYLNSGKIKKSNKKPIDNNRIYNREEALRELMRDRQFRFYVWNKLWKMSLFRDNNITMPIMIYEDMVVSSMLFCHAEKVVSTDYRGYIYTRAFSKYKEVSMSKKRINDYIRTVPCMRKYLEDRNLYKTAKLPFFRHIAHVFFSVPLLVIQANKSLERGILKNSLAGMGKVIKCVRSPTDKLADLIEEEVVM